VVTAPSIQPYIDVLPPPIKSLGSAANEEGHAFVQRTVDEWRSGANRFDKFGEAFFLASIRSETVGMCGINIDTHLDDPTVGRLRHLYVHPNHRTAGLGERLVMMCLDHAIEHFELVRLRTPGPMADQFYDKLGFERSASPTATHVWTVERR
jgi:GNAT superfamily N-acetyltransferase